jgi:type II secretory pathway pseudopilin PulG
VITVLALLAAVVGTRIGGAQQRASFEQAIAQWEFFDQQLRIEARRHGQPVQARLELGTGRLVREAVDRGRRTAATQSLAGNIRIARFTSATRDAKTGNINVTYGPQGTSETFAVKLAGPGARQEWLLVAGVSGQMTRVEKDSEVEDVLQALAPAGVYTR